MREDPPFVWGTPEVLQGTATKTLSHHLVHVLALQRGDTVRLVCGDGFVYLMRLLDVHSTATRVEMVERIESRTDPTVDVTLVVGALKGEQMMYVVQQLTELGVTRIVPMETERSVPRLPFRSQPRWQQAAWDSAVVCGRSGAPAIELGSTLADAVSRPWDGRRLMCVERRAELQGCAQVLAASEGPVALFVGPEDGFSAAEMQLAARAGLTPCTLGPRMLRGMTAAIAAATLALAARGQLQ
jgi:16S rRNA (uracil1498-N3)-methyltransferase